MTKKILLLLSVLFYGFSAFPQGLFETLNSGTDKSDEETSYKMNGYVRASAYGGSPEYDYSSVFGELALQTRLSHGNTFLFADFRVREGLFFNERKTVFDLKEAYAGYLGKHFSVYLGNQIVSWGRADGFNPTNNITPNDYFFLTPEQDDQRMSNFMIRSKVILSKVIDLELIAIPFFKGSNYRYDLFDMGSEAEFEDAVLPDKTFENLAYAARLNFNLPVAGFSVSYFNGYDPFYGFNVKDVQLFPITRIYYRPEFYRKSTIGADFDFTAGRSIFRGEVAYDHTNDYVSNMHVPNPALKYVVGLENVFFDIMSVIQYVGQYTFDHYELIEPEFPDSQDPSVLMQYGYDMVYFESELFNRKIFQQQKEFNHALMISLSRPFYYENIRAEFTAYYNFTSEEYLIRPNISYNITDNLSVNAGASLMYGPGNSIYDYAGKILNGFYMSMKASF